MFKPGVDSHLVVSTPTAEYGRQERVFEGAVRLAGRDRRVERIRLRDNNDVDDFLATDPFKRYPKENPGETVFAVEYVPNRASNPIDVPGIGTATATVIPGFLARLDGSRVIVSVTAETPFPFRGVCSQFPGATLLTLNRDPGLFISGGYSGHASAGFHWRCLGKGSGGTSMALDHG